MNVTLITVGKHIWISRRPASDFVNMLTLLSECVPAEEDWRKDYSATETKVRAEVSLSVVDESTIKWLPVMTDPQTTKNTDENNPDSFEE